MGLHILLTWRTVPLAKITFEGLTQWVARLSPSGRVVFGTPKSHQSRTVPMPRFVAAELAAATCSKHADDWCSLTMPRGSVVRLSNWRRATFLPARDRAGLSTRFRIHDLRHTAASPVSRRATKVSASPVLRTWGFTG